MTHETPSPDAPISDAEIAELEESFGDEWDGVSIVGVRIDLVRRLIAELSRLRAAQAGGVAGWQLVPSSATRAWATSLAELQQGQSSSPRCEPPAQWEIDKCGLAISLALVASPPPPVAQPMGVERIADSMTARSTPDSGEKS